MNARLTDQEIASFRDALRGYEPAQEVLDSLQNHQGDFEASFNDFARQRFGDRQTFDGDESSWQNTLEKLREEICGDEGLRKKIKELEENPHSKVIFEILVGLILLKALALGILLDASVATIIILYLFKVGPDLFCRAIGQPPPPDAT